MSSSASTPPSHQEPSSSSPSGTPTNHKEQAKVTQEWNSCADNWDDLAAGYRDSFETLLWQIIGQDKQQEERSQWTVLDFGCGTGLLTEKLQACVKRVICIDASPAMIQQVDYKIKAREWDNVVAYTAVLGQEKMTEKEVQNAIDSLRGQVDLIVASSVLSFIPDKESTIRALATLLKPEGGILCHSDWPQGPDNKDGFTNESAAALYAVGGLVAKSQTIQDLDMGGGHVAKVFIGVAEKSQ